MRARRCAGLLLLLLLTAIPTAIPYPLDGAERTGIARLEGYRLAQEGQVRGRRLPEGALLKSDEVDLRLTGHADVEIPEADPEFTAKVRALLGADADRYGLAVLDLSRPEKPLYAEHRGAALYNPGSVGKLLVALGVFQALADIYPEDIAARERILLTTMVTADEVIHHDRHEVPFWDAATRKLSHRPLKVGDRGNLWTYLDWMLSASSNAAASMVMKELLLLTHFGHDYPVSDSEAQSFWKNATRKELGELLVRAVQEPVVRNGLNLSELRQGKFFTRQGQERVPGPSSHASARELMRFLFKLEQGRLVDPFSSREIKRLLFMTQRRIRYASAPALSGAAIYFKSGSLYACRAEADFTCGKYRGNVINMMNSVAIIEAPAGKGRLHYLVVVMSNVLRENSAVAHQTLATRVHRLIEASDRDGQDGTEKDDRSDRPGRQ